MCRYLNSCQGIYLHWKWQKEPKQQQQQYGRLDLCPAGFSDKDCLGSGKKEGYHIHNCIKVSQTETDKIWNRTKKEWAQKEKNEEAASKTGLDHLSTDEKAAEAVISVDATAT